MLSPLLTHLKRHWPTWLVGAIGAAVSATSISRHARCATPSSSSIPAGPRLSATRAWSLPRSGFCATMAKPSRGIYMRCGSISGTIEGAPGGVRDASTPSWMMVIRSSPVVAALQFFYVLAIAFLAGNARGARRTRGEYARGVVPPEVEASLRAHLSRRRRQIAVLVAVVTWIGAGATVLEARVSGRQRARSNVVQSVPHSLRP